MRSAYLIVGIIFFSISQNGYSQTVFYSYLNNSKNIAKFESSAPLETIVGVGNRIRASVIINTTDILKNPQGKVRFELSSLITGIDKRDEDLKSETYLNTAKFPNAEFVLTGLSNVSSKELTDKSKIAAIANGKFTIHGITREISAPIILYYFKENTNEKNVLKGNILSVSTIFSIKLSDYGIKIPSILFYKLEDEINISAAFVASDVPELVRN